MLRLYDMGRIFNYLINTFATSAKPEWNEKLMNIGKATIKEHNLCKQLKQSAARSVAPLMWGMWKE